MTSVIAHKVEVGRPAQGLRSGQRGVLELSNEGALVVGSKSPSAVARLTSVVLGMKQINPNKATPTLVSVLCKGSENLLERTVTVGRMLSIRPSLAPGNQVGRY